MKQDNSSRHKKLLRSIPLYDSDLALISQRRLTLYGVRARHTPEEQVESDMKKELRALLPDVFGGDISLPSGERHLA